MLALPCGFVSLAHLAETGRQNLYRIPHDIYLVFGIPRSGIIPAYAIAVPELTRHRSVRLSGKPAYRP
jgi:hypothetical protein